MVIEGEKESLKNPGKAEIHREMVLWPNCQNGFVVLGCLGSQGSKGKFLQFCYFIILLRVVFSYLFSWTKQTKNLSYIKVWKLSIFAVTNTFWSLDLLEAIQGITLSQHFISHLLNFGVFHHVFISSLDMNLCI